MKKKLVILGVFCFFCAQAPLDKPTYLPEVTLGIKFNPHHNLEIWEYANVDTSGGYKLILYRESDSSQENSTYILSGLSQDIFYKGYSVDPVTNKVINRFTFLPEEGDANEYMVDLSGTIAGSQTVVFQDARFNLGEQQFLDFPWRKDYQIDTCNYPLIFIHGFSNNFGIWRDMIDNISDNGNCYNLGYKEFDKLPEKIDKNTVINFSYYYETYQDWLDGVMAGDATLKINYGRIGDGKNEASKETYSYRYRGYYRLTPEEYYGRESYAQRLAGFVSGMLKHYPPTLDHKVYIVAHSMGGLVSRAYIRWYGGDETVSRIILAATPNHGVPKIGARFVPLIKGRKFVPEILELSKRREWHKFGRFNLSFTGFLNRDSEVYGSEWGIKYYTIAYTTEPLLALADGRTPKKLFGIIPDDGVVSIDGVHLEGALANAVVGEEHHTDGPNAERGTISIRSNETEYFIRRWIFGND